MRTLNEIIIEIAETRAELLAPDVTDELAAELRSKLRTLEQERVDVLRSGPNSNADPETRERREIAGRVTMADYAGAALREGSLDGAAAELQAALGIGSTVRAGDRGVLVPMSLFGEPREPETRADAASSLAAAAAPSEETWIDRQFRPKIADWFLGPLGMLSVPAGEHNVNVVTAGDDGTEPAAGTSKDAVEITETTTSLKPRRRVVRAVFRDVDDLRSPGWSEAVRRDLGLALGVGLDGRIISGAAPNGLVEAINADSAVGNDADEVTFGAATGKVKPDGTYASGYGDLKLLLGADTNGVWSGKLAANTATSPQMWLEAQGVQCRVVPDAVIGARANNKNQALLVRRGIRRDAVLAVWEVARLVRDEYTRLSRGETALQITAYWDFTVTRTGGFVLARSKLAA